MKRIYISGPMSGIDNYNHPAFHDAADALRASGLEPISPADIPVQDGWQWIDYILADIPGVFAADGVATLDGCEDSNGSLIECRIAEHRGIPVKPLAEWLA